MRREELLRRLDDPGFCWDVLVIGGGATGLGAAVDAASRGYSTVLVEQHDFAKGTSSRSTKLIHGGVRYLRQGHIGLVREALHERGLLRRLAPHLVSDLEFVVPLYDWWEGPFYGLGFKLYDQLAGDLGLGPSRRLNRAQTLALLPNVNPRELRGGVIYHDAQFDDARFAISLARTLDDLHGVPLNYLKVVRLRKRAGRVTGVLVRDMTRPDAPERELRARVTINATGVFCDNLRRMDDRSAAPLLQVSQGVHLVLDGSFLPGRRAIMVPRTEDGRVLFAVPWHGRVLLGTTDTPRPRAQLEPRPLAEEVDFLLRHAARYLAHPPAANDVLSAFAGLRPLLRQAGVASTAQASREHLVEVAPSGLVTIAGGKWTTYRSMGVHVVNEAARAAGLPERPSQTEHLLVHGWTENPSAQWPGYGEDAEALQAMVTCSPALGQPLHPRLPVTGAEVVWAVREEMALTVEDVLARRTRCLLLDARASVEVAPAVARIMAKQSGAPADGVEAQVSAYGRLARRHLL